MRLRIVPYKKGSHSAKLLAQALSKRFGYTVFRGPPRPNRINIRWGIPDGIGANKLSTFNAFKQHGVSCPEFTTDPGVAKKWLATVPILARKYLNSSGGKGAVYLDRGSDLVPAPLYVKYIPKRKEFRVHVWGDNVILVQEKRKRRGADPDPKIRSHENDWVFCVSDIVAPGDLLTVARMAVEAVGHGGAVDVVWNEKLNKCFALEVNSAPGLCPTTAKVYAEAM